MYVYVQLFEFTGELRTRVRSHRYFSNFCDMRVPGATVLCPECGEVRSLPQIIYLSTYLPIYLPIYLLIYLLIYLSICLFVYLSLRTHNSHIVRLLA